MDKITEQYVKARNKGYAGTARDFRQTMKSQSGRDQMYNTLNKLGATDLSREQWNASFAPTAAKTQVPPSSKLGTTPSSTTAQQSAWNNPTTQDRIRILQQIHAPLNDFNESSKERAAQLQRVGEHLTPEGRKKQKALELEARLAGARTKVLGLTAPPTATKDNEAQGSNDEDDVAPIPNEQSPVPYGVKYIDGKPVTNWLLPDGSLTTDITEADQAEYTARTNRLASEATKSVDNRLRHAKEQLEELKRKHDERKSQVDKEWTEEVEKHPIISAIADEQGNGYWKYQILDTENASWREAIHEKEDQIKALEEERDRQADKSVGAWRAIKRKLLDSRLWDGGSQDLSGAMAKQRASKAKHRTEAEEALMKAIYENQEVEDLYGDNASFWYRAGAIAGESIPFMVDFVLSGGGGKAINIGTKVAAKTAAKIATKEVLKRMTEYGIKQYARKAVVKAGVWTIKALGTTADELFIRAPLMANTIQANKTAADIINRKLGNVVVDENGNYDFSNDKTWGSAIWQGEANAIIENYSEMFGSHLEKALPMLAKTFGGKRISGMLARANASDFGRILNTTKKYFQYLGISDYVGEVAEEYYGQLWRTMLNLDDAYTYVPVYDAQGNPMVDENGNPITERKNLLFTGQFNADIWGGMALSMGLMGAAKYGVSGAAYAKMKHDVNKASQTASQVFGQDEWKPLRETIDNTTNEDMGEMMETFLSDPNLSETERAAAMTYMERTLNLRGANLASVAQSRGEGAQADETGNPADNRSEAFNRGYNATEQEQHDIVAEFENADPNSENYTELQNAYNGVVQHINDNATAITEQQREIDQKTRHSDGSIRPATLTETNDDGANRFVYIVEGNAQSAQDGSVDLENSDNSVVVYDPNTGERRMVAPDAILSFEEPTSSEDYEARLESKRQENVAAQLEYLRGSQENQQQGQPTDQQQSQPVDEQSPTEQATSGTIEGTPSQFVDGMGLTVRTGQGDVPAMVMSVGRVEDGQFIPDANGSTVELMMDGEVKYIDAEKLSPSIVSYQNPQATNTDAQQQEQTTADNASNTTEQQTQQQTSAANMQVGDTFQVTDDAGNPTTARVIEVNADGIVVDFDTPVGGQSVAMLTPEQVDSIRLTEQTNNQAHQDGKEPTNVSEQEKPQESTDTPKQETQTEQTQPTQEGQKPTDRQSQPVAEQTITEQGGAADETTKEDNRPIAEDVIGDLQQKYGDNAQHKVEQTHKAATVKAEKARKAVEKAQKAYDDAPIGDEEVKAENALKKAQAAYEKAKAEERYWAEVEHRMNNANGKDAANIKAGAEVEIKTPNGVARAKVIGVDPKTGVVRYTYNKPTAEGQGVQYGEASMGEMQQMMLDAKLDANGGAVMRTRPQQSQRQKVTNSEQRQNRTAPSEVTETRQEQTEAKEEAKQEENPEESNEREEKPNESTEETEDTTEETAEPKEGESTEEERDQEQATEEEREHERGREAAIAKIGAEKVKLIEKIAKAVGAKVVWHETMDANGYYLNGAIHIAADAESLQGAENAIESVFGHESTHLIREMGTEPYQQLRDAVKDMMGEEAWNELVEKKKKLYADAGFEENDDYYEEEAVADMVGKLLSDEASLTELSGKLNRTLLDKIIDTLRKILNAFRGKKDVGELSEYQQKIQNAINTIERAFVTAQEIANYFGMTSETENGTTRGARFSVTAQAEGLGMEMVKDDGNGNVGLKAPDGTIYNVDNPLTVEAVKAMKDSSMNFMLADAREISGLTKERENQIWEKYVALMNTYLVEGRKEVGGWERVASNWQWIAESVYKTVSTNGDKQYGYSLDITRICKKNEAVINSISEMQRRVGYGITPGQIMEIYYESYKQGYQVPCPVCYVFSRYIRNGQFASVMINGQRKYGQYLTDPSKLSEGQKAERIKFWEAELEKVTAENKKNKAAITSAKRDITETLVLVDRLSLELGKKGITEARRKEIEAQVYALDARYRAALNVVSQASLDSWIKCFAIEQSNSRPTTLREDSWQGFPENMALDLRETATVVMTYPAIQRYRNTRGAAAGKELAWAANNDIGDVPMMVGSSSAVKDLPRAEERSEEERQAIIDNEEYGKLKLGARNLYYKAAHAKTRAERAVYLEAARKRFKSAHVYAQQQSLRGGQRHWSWSDNIERLSPDVFINIMQMELLGGAMQAYSKQLEGIQLASAMGAYVNGSLMGKGKGYSEVDEKDLAFTESGQAYVKGRDFTFKGENGDVVTMKAAAWKDPKDGKYYTLEFDPVVGVDPFGSEGKEGLFHLNAKYDKAGNILVCMNDIHCRTAMADQRIHFIIPWHASGANNHILNQMYNVLNVEFDRSTDATDYTMVQEEKKFNANGNKRIHPDLLSFWEDHYDNPRQYGNAGEYSGKSFRCGIKGGIESSDGHQHLSKGQLHYRELHDAVLVGIDMPVFDKDGNPVLNSSGRQKTVQTDVREANPEWYREIMADEFLSQAYRKIHETVETGFMSDFDKEFIYPYEYWDETSTFDTADVNTPRYLEYCRRLGYKPKFIGGKRTYVSERMTAENGDGVKASKAEIAAMRDAGNFCEDMGYWKLLIDRRMYDTKGKFQDLTPVSVEGFETDMVNPDKNAEQFDVTRVADEEASKRIVDQVIANEKKNLPGGQLTVDYDLTLDEALKTYKQTVADTPRGAIPKKYSLREGETALALANRITNDRKSAAAMEQMGLSQSEVALRDALVDNLRTSGIDVITDVEQGQRVLDMVNGENDFRMEANHSEKSEAARKREETNNMIDWAVSFVSGKSMQQARAERHAREDARRKEAKEIYDAVLRKDFNPITLQRINDYIDNATPQNPYGRRISQRVPQRMERSLHAGERTNAIEALFSRICEGAVAPSRRSSKEGRREIEKAKEESLKAWAQATGNWHTDIADFTHNTTPIANTGTDSRQVYLSNDGKSVIKVSYGKGTGKKFSPDIDAINLFNHVFPNSAYKVLGYGEMNGEFVKFLEQPFVDMGSAVPLSVEERVEYMGKLGFKPINKENTAFSNGEIVAADVQKSNIVKSTDGNIRVIDADVKLHTKDFGGKYTYLAVEEDTRQRFGNVREHRVFHGSAADFDRFDHSHMGEGEGAQAYGWGTYVTDVEGVGRGYAKQSAENNRIRSTIGARPMGFIYRKEKLDYPSLVKRISKDFDIRETFVTEYVYDLAYKGKAEAKKDVEEEIRACELLNRQYNRKIISDEKIAGLKKLLAETGTNIIFDSDVRYLYTVEIPDDNGSNYLEWDKDYNEDEVYAITERLLDVAADYEKKGDLDNAELFRDAAESLGERMDKQIAEQSESQTLLGEIIYYNINDDPKTASQILNRADFTGIKYPANYRRGGNNKGDSNYVIFNEEDAKITDQVRFFKTATGEAYGYTIGGKIYIDPRIATAETPIHEYTHLWAEATRLGDNKKWSGIVDLVKGLPQWDEVAGRYSELTTDDAIAEEVLAHYSGARGAERLREEQKRILDSDATATEKAAAVGALSKIRQAVKRFWQQVAKMFGIRNTNINDVADMVLTDLLNGRNVAEEANGLRARDNAGATESEDIRYQFIGEQGAAALDKAEEANTRLNNLNVARQMEDAEKDAKAIKIATGWERGADGKWRYEIPDFNIDSAIKELEVKAKEYQVYNTSKRINKLIIEHYEEKGDLEKAEEFRKELLSKKFKAPKATTFGKLIGEDHPLLKAYPSLADIKVSFVVRGNDYGSYDHVRNRITLNYDWLNYDVDSVRTTLNHEIQHAIQAIEGYEKGSDGSAYAAALIKNTMKNMYSSYAKNTRNLEERAIVQDRINSLKSLTKDDAYNRHAGEVEARNVVARLNMTEEQRRQSLASETEDVARRDQLFINGAFAYNAISNEFAKRAAKQSAAGVKYSLRDKATPKEVANWVADYDKANDSELGRFTQFLERGKKLRENESSQFKIGKAGDLLQSNGITGNIYVSTNAVNERMHTNDADHNIPARTWVDIADTMNEPLAIASYGDSGRGYRIYTSARVNGKTVAVGMDVNRTGEISNITTAYGRDLSKGLRNDNIVYKNDAKIKQMTNEFSPDPNRQVYHQSSVTDANIDNNSETTKSRYSLRENESALDLARRITEQADSKRLRYALRNAPAPNYQKAMIRDQYDRLITKGAYQAREAIQDSMLSLRRAMEMIIKAERKNGKANAGVKYIEDVDGFENAYLGENRLSSVNKAEIDYVSRFLFTPMVKEVAKLAKTKEERAQLIDYMMAKHGLERNEVLARRDAKEAHEKANNKYHPVGQLKSEDEYYNEFRKRDYSGLLALTRGVDANVENLLTRVDALEEQIRQAQFDGNVNLERSLKKQYKKAMEDAVQYAEKAAARMVNDYESNHQTDDLWNSVHAVSDYTLRKQLETGMISKDLYDQVRKMFEHYIPLRGFDETTTSDEYTYLSSGRGATNTKIRKAAGRISKADDPFASLESMMESTIMEGNRNQLVKQRFLNFVKRHPSDLISVDDLWLEYDAASGEWRPRFCNTIRPNDSAADVERKIRDFNNNMEAAANAQPDIYRRASDNPNIRYRVVGDMKAREHQVIVRRGGKDIVLTINGNPRLAQALNGMTNPDNDLTGAVGKAVEVAMGVNRYLSAMYTTMNPDFVLSNFCRDMFYSATSVPAKENAHYAVTFWGNLAKCNPVNLMRLYERYNAGKLANPQTEIEKHFVEFLRNGGETGFIQARTQEKVKQEIAKMLRNRGQKIPLNQVLGIIGEQYEMANRAVENAARFAAFVTSRAEGRTLDRSIYDAKEVSVNFNKKGAGFKMYDAVEQKNLGKAAAFMSGMGRTTYLFWNASVQGSTNYLRMVRRHPAKALAVGTGLFAMGMLSSLAGALIGGDDDKKKDSYFDTPEATRRANIMFRAGDGFVKVPLPVEYRVFYGMGELCMSTMLGQTDYSTGELAKQVTGTLTQAMPLDVLGDSQPAMVFVPDAIKPIVQGAANSNWTGLPLYKDTPWNKDDPEYTKAYKSASRGSIAVSKFVNDATGGDAHKKGWGDTWLTNPGVIENLLSGYAGGAWSWVNKMVQTAEMATGQREFDPKGVILLSRVYQQGDERTANRVLNEKYYRLRDHYNKFDALLKDYKADKKAGIYDYADKITEMISQPEYKKMKGFKALNKKIKDVTKKMNTAPTPKKAEEYEAELKRLKQQAIEQYSVNK